MKRLLVLTLLVLTQLLYAQYGVRLNTTEFFTLSAALDPNASIKEGGPDIVAEIEYAGSIYAKVGFESFSALYGHYKEGHGAVGVNLTSGLYEKTRFYAGIRLARVWRGCDGANRPIFGFEGGTDLDLSKSFFIGLRGTIDKRYDQEIFRWSPQWKVSGFVRVGYKWYYKNAISRN